MNTKTKKPTPKPKVSMATKKKQKAAAQINALPPALRDLVIEELKAIAFTNTTEAFDKKWQVIPRSKLSPNTLKAIASVRTHDYTNKKGKPGTRTCLKFYDKIKALEALGRVEGIFEKDNSQVGESLAKQLADIHKQETEDAKQK